VYNNRLYLAWKGEYDAVGIWASSFDGTNWSPQQQQPEAGTSDEPALAVFSGRLHLAWKGEYDAVGIWASSYDGASWSPQLQVPQAGTSAGPALATYNNELYFAWKGERDAVGIWWSSFNAFPPTQLQFDTGWLTSGLPLGGYAQIVMNQNGDFDYRSHAHDSGFDNINYTISAVLMTPDGFAFVSQHSGSVEGTVAGLPFGTPNRNDDFVAPAANNPQIPNHWDGILRGQLTARIDGTDTIVLGIEGIITDMVKAAAAAIGQAAAKAVIALIVG
jgi:hypothetical protein